MSTSLNQDWFITAADAARPLFTFDAAKGFIPPSDLVDKVIPDSVKQDIFAKAAAGDFLGVVDGVHMAGAVLETVVCRAVGTSSVDKFKEDPNIDSIQTKYKFGDTATTVNIARQTSYPNPRRGEEGQADRITYFGETTVRRSPKGFSALTEARESLRAYAADLIGGK